MATKKKAAKRKAGKIFNVGAGAFQLSFDVHKWGDPGPDLRSRLSAGALKQLDQAKLDFAKRVNGIFKNR
jgi:hypothetical protein